MRLGFVGLGRMGSRMAARLAGAGHDLVVYDLDPAAMARLTERGAAAAASVVEVGDRADLVLTSLPGPAAVQAAVMGESGLAAGTRIRHVVDLSTTGAPVIRAVAAKLAERGIGTVDAPVSGGTRGADQGTLAVMAAGPAAELAVAGPVLTALGRVFHVGSEPGLGQTMKLLNNYLVAAVLATTAEALVVGAKAGLDARTMIDVLNAGSGRNTATTDKFPRAVLPRTFDAGFATGLMTKDLGLFAEEAARAGVPLPVGAAVHRLWQQTADELGPASDFTSIVRLVEDWAGVEVGDATG